MRLLLLLCLLTGVAHAGDAVLSWTPPTQNTDGSALTDLAGYRIHYGQSPSVLVQTIELSNPALLSYVVEGLSEGTWYFGIKAYTENSESDLSNIASKTITDAVPISSPPILTVSDLIAYQIAGILNSVKMLPVGEVPGDTQCNPNRSISIDGKTYYVVDRALVDWYGSVQPQATFAQCSG